MIVTLAEFSELARDDYGGRMQLGGGHLASQTVTAAGAFAATQANAELVRIGTDTAITVDVYDGSDPLFMPANSVEFFPVAGGQTLTVALA